MSRHWIDRGIASAAPNQCLSEAGRDFQGDFDADGAGLGEWKKQVTLADTGVQLWIGHVSPLRPEGWTRKNGRQAASHDPWSSGQLNAMLQRHPEKQDTFRLTRKDLLWCAGAYCSWNAAGKKTADLCSWYTFRKGADPAGHAQVQA